MHTSTWGSARGGSDSYHLVVFANLIRIWKCVLIVADIYTQDIC